MRLLFKLTVLGFMATAFFVFSARAAERQIRIGLSLDTLNIERWKKDRDIFVERAEELGARVIVQSANSDAAVQNAQCENMLTQGVDILVIIPFDSKAAARAVKTAHEEGVKVLSYDRLILDSDVDMYISFDNEQVGFLQAEYVLRKAPKGKYFMLGGAPTDNNAKLLRKGQMRALKDALDRGDIEIVGDQWCDNWSPEVALKHVENALTRQGNDIQAVVASNDGTAGGAIQALAAQGLAGKVPVSGQDADLAACQRVVKGTQAVTVYKPIKTIATRAAEIAVAMARGENIEGEIKKTSNGKTDVPSILLTPIQVDKDNIDEIVIKDGFHTKEAVYGNKE
jgi:D-xylose transport system substrate-binding protein